MKSKQVRAVVYSGKVGAKMTPAKRGMPSRAKGNYPMTCTNGPMDGHILYISTNETLTFTYMGEKGRYVQGLWEAV